ncbi:MAG: 16S rRNA (guanine(966)-N(2))-methyltransferase RsmD [Dehalococcoidia bacterium]
MRIISGEARGRRIAAPRGMQTRPTSDLMRGVIFSMLASMGVHPSSVLDLYAGTGALGIEALSRGAESVAFVERDRSACAVIRANLLRTGYAERAHVFCLPVERFLTRRSGPYTVVFADPPYADPAIVAVLGSLAKTPAVDPMTTLVYEHSRRTEPPPVVGRLGLRQTRTHGDSSVSFYRYTQPATVDEEARA